MVKYIFFILISSFIGAITAPNFLMADHISVKSPGYDAVLTVEEKPVVVEEAEVVTVQAEPQVYIAPATPATPVYTPPMNQITIAGRSIQINDVADTSVDSGNFVNKYGPSFLYGHNSWNVFGSLVNVPAGSVFSVTYGGVVTNYQVTQVVIFEKNTGNGLLQLNGGGNYMRRVANATHDGVQYDLSIMTCYGTSYGNGDASHRLVLFANAI